MGGAGGIHHCLLIVLESDSVPSRVYRLLSRRLYPLPLKNLTNVDASRPSIKDNPSRLLVALNSTDGFLSCFVNADFSGRPALRLAAIKEGATH
uniref:Uncharacterized protein n=1 Tax=Cucumis sativus TaxID=3659 RepID=A0A0A0L5A1_CUCSA